MNVTEKIARAMCEVQRYAATENELARAIDEVPGFLVDLQRHGLAVVPLEPTEEMRRAYNDAVVAGDMRHLLPATAWEVLLNSGRAT